MGRSFIGGFSSPSAQVGDRPLGVKLEYEKLIKCLTIVAIVISGAEKLVSCIEQSMFPETIEEANPMAQQVFNMVGLEVGHLLFFVISVFIALFAYWLATKPKKYFEARRRVLRLYESLGVSVLSVMIIGVIYTLANNIQLLLIHL